MPTVLVTGPTDQGFRSVTSKKFHDFSRTFQDTRNVFPGHCRSTAIFKCTQIIQCGSTIHGHIAGHSSQVEKKVL